MRPILILFLIYVLFIQPVTAFAESSGLGPTYRIPLRVHLSQSERLPALWPPILEEINSIWKNQAGICFDMHIVMHDEPIEQGLDIWFHSSIPDWNGYFTGPHDIHVRDDPDLRPAKKPAGSSAARTAAHELGHALDLDHRQDSDDNLMRSKTYGWQLHADEIARARRTVEEMPFVTTNGKDCRVILPTTP